MEKQVRWQKTDITIEDTLLISIPREKVGTVADSCSIIEKDGTASGDADNSMIIWFCLCLYGNYDLGACCILLQCCCNGVLSFMYLSYEYNAILGNLYVHNLTALYA